MICKSSLDTLKPHITIALVLQADSFEGLFHSEISIDARQEMEVMHRDILCSVQLRQQQQR